jgi:DNA polymerase-3 subunit epsilon
MGRCGAPCEGREDVESYAHHVAAVRAALTTDVRQVVSVLSRRVSRLADVERFEDAAVHRDRLAALVRVAARAQRLSALTRCAELVGARLRENASWEIVVVRYGRLVGTALARPDQDPRPVAEAVVASAEVVVPGPGPAPAASAEETECVLRWLERPGLRLIGLEGTWASPAYGAGGVRLWADAAEEARTALTGGLADRRDLHPVHQPGAMASRWAG